MKSDSPKDVFEENLSKMLNSTMKKTDTAFDENLTRAVLTEVDKQRSALRYRLFFKKMSLAAAAAVVIAIAVIWFANQGPAESVGQVRNIYGIVTVSNGNTSEKVLETADVRSEQWIETLSGSKAEILLKDKSKLWPAPRTVLKISNGKGGQQVLLQKGFVTIEAAKQPPGKSLTIKTDGSKVRVLGTRLDVRLVKKTDGSKRTRVSVASGSVELESAGKKVLLPANTEGIADEGKTPVKRPSNLEVNEMVRLFNRNKELAIQSNVKAGLPAIIYFKGGSSAAVWTMVPHDKLEETKAGQYLLKLKYPSIGAKVFTLEGAELPVSGQGRNLKIDCSSLDVDPSQINQLVLYLPEVKGIFQSDEGNLVRFDRPASSSPIVTLFQFRLPELTNIEQIHPEPIETARKLNKLLITVATDSSMLEVFE
jgi:ferric-dicitrate binding protein FerR (iron transport regulator)